MENLKKVKSANKNIGKHGKWGVNVEIRANPETIQIRKVNLQGKKKVRLKKHGNWNK